MPKGDVKETLASLLKTDKRVKETSSTVSFRYTMQVFLMGAFIVNMKDTSGTSCKAVGVVHVATSAKG